MNMGENRRVTGMQEVEDSNADEINKRNLFSCPQSSSLVESPCSMQR